MESGHAYAKCRGMFEQYHKKAKESASADGGIHDLFQLKEWMTQASKFLMSNEMASAAESDKISDSLIGVIAVDMVGNNSVSTIPALIAAKGSASRAFVRNFVDKFPKSIQIAGLIIRNTTAGSGTIMPVEPGNIIPPLKEQLSATGTFDKDAALSFMMFHSPFARTTNGTESSASNNLKRPSEFLAAIFTGFRNIGSNAFFPSYSGQDNLLEWDVESYYTKRISGCQDQSSLLYKDIKMMPKNIREAEWTRAHIDSLPDSCFAFIEDGGTKDSENKTKPRSLRHFPFKDAEGKVDLPHLRNAMARAPQSPFGEKAMPMLKKAAKMMGVGEYAKESGNGKYNVHETLPLAESGIVPDIEDQGQKHRSNRAWWPLLKAGPGNPRDKNYYTEKALESLGERLLARPKMFFDHIPGEVRPVERNVKDWAASIKERKIENGVLYGLVQAYDPWLKERMYDAPDELAASIEARGKANGKIKHNGEDWNAIESVPWLNAVNIVDYPGNAPMGISLTEGDADKDDPKEETYMTIAELKEKNAELYAELVKEIKEAGQAELDAKIKEKDAEIAKLKESQTSDAKTITNMKEFMVKLEARVDGFEVLSKKKDRDQSIKEAMAKLPAEALTDKFKELVEKAPSKEAALELIEERSTLLSGKVLGHGPSGPIDKETSAKEREKLMFDALGIKVEEKK